MTARSSLTVVLAAGEGTRMRSALPKVLHPVAGQSLLSHVLRAAPQGQGTSLAVVVGPDHAAVDAETKRLRPDASTFVQRERLGTAHAVTAQSAKTNKPGLENSPVPLSVQGKDRDSVARGSYLVNGVAECFSCHTTPAGYLAGGLEFPLPLTDVQGFTSVFSRNLTPDPETGLGNVSDSAIARALRFSVGHDGRALLPFMEMQGLSDGRAFAVGEDHLCAVQSRRVRCRGKNDHGQLARHDLADAGFHQVSGTELHDVGQLASGPYATCAIDGDGDGELVCWGKRVKR